MGLDMFLFRKNGEEIGYWRKANAIHGWFVNECQGGVDECQKTKVSKVKLRSLLSKVNSVLRLADNDKSWENKARSVLPSQSGFFFGGTEYDEYYLDDLRNTKRILEKALKEDGEIYYQSSW